MPNSEKDPSAKSEDLLDLIDLQPVVPSEKSRSLPAPGQSGDFAQATPAQVNALQLAELARAAERAPTQSTEAPITNALPAASADVDANAAQAQKKLKKRRMLLGAGAAVLVVLGAAGAIVRAHRMQEALGARAEAEERARANQPAPPTKVPALEPAGPVPVERAVRPTPIVTALTRETLSSLDCFSLADAIGTKAIKASQPNAGRLAWAAFRHHLRCDTTPSALLLPSTAHLPRDAEQRLYWQAAQHAMNAITGKKHKLAPLSVVARQTDEGRLAYLLETSTMLKGTSSNRSDTSWPKTPDSLTAQLKFRAQDPCQQTPLRQLLLSSGDPDDLANAFLAAWRTGDTQWLEAGLLPLARAKDADVLRALVQSSPAHASLVASLRVAYALYEGQLNRARQAVGLWAALKKDDGQPAVALEKLGACFKGAEVEGAASSMTQISSEIARLLGRASPESDLMWIAAWQPDPLAAAISSLSRRSEAEGAKHAHHALELLRADRPEDERILEGQIALGAAASQPAWSAAALQALLDRHPKDEALGLKLGLALFADHRIDEALAALEAVVQQNSQARNAAWLLAHAQVIRGQDPIRARDDIAAAAKLEPKVATYLALAELEQHRGHQEEALEALAAAHKIDPGSYDVSLLSARLMFEREDFVRAADECRDVLKRDPHNVAASELLGDILHAQGDLKEAARAYQEAALAENASAALLLKIGRMELQELGQLAPAVRELRRVLLRDPAATEAHYLLGLALHDLGERKEAASHMRAYLKHCPTGQNAGEAQLMLDGLSRAPAAAED